MNFNYFIAKRYLFSKKESKFVSFITYISVLGVALGVAVLIVAVSILNGFEQEIKTKVAGLVSHVQITSFNPEGLENYTKVIENTKGFIGDITGISPFVQKEAAIRNKEAVEGIMLKGIIPESDVSTSRNRIVEGDFNLTPIDSTFSRLVVGDKLAKKLNIKVGNKVIVFGINGIPSPLNIPRLKQFIVSGIYETGLRDYDDVLIYTDLKSAQKLFELSSNVTGIEIKLKDIDKAEQVVKTINEKLGYPFYPRSLFKLYRGLFTWVELQKAPTPIILGLIIIVATFNIVGTLLMLILEKTHSVGILKSLGATNISVMKIFIFDGLIIGGLGIIFGNIIGIGLSLLELKYHFFKLPEQYYMKSVPILLQPEYIILISIITLALVFISTLIPSYIASRFNPIKSLRFV